MATKETPLMKQYNRIKSKYPDAMLLFRVGDFYETFGSDAVKCSKILGIVLTKRANGSASHIELAGFPHHSLNIYLPKLVKAGLRVAICDQLENPKLTKKIVKRGVTELISPGVTLNDEVLDAKDNNFLGAIHVSGDVFGISFLDISTGEFYVSQGNLNLIQKLIADFAPKELLFERQKRGLIQDKLGYKGAFFVFDDWVFKKDFANEKLCSTFNISSLKGFGIENFEEGTIAAGVIIHYLFENHQNKLKHINSIQKINHSDYLWMDGFTMRNLELCSTQFNGCNSLIEIIDKTKTPMGGRLIKNWVLMPLKSKEKINLRLDAVEDLFKNTSKLENISEGLSRIGDIERIVSKIATEKINPKELFHLKNYLNEINPILSLVGEGIKKCFENEKLIYSDCDFIKNKIENTLSDNPPLMVSKGNVLGEGVSEELDDLRKRISSGKEHVNNMMSQESEKHGIPSLKISFNNVFGYFYEVRNTYKDKVPEDWIRKQTLVNAERYITPELKEYEEITLNAESKIMEIEEQLFRKLVLDIKEHLKILQTNSRIIAYLDCLHSMAIISKDNNYVKPIMSDEKTLELKDCRHPVIEQSMSIGEQYIPNDVKLSDDDCQIMIITGPNMAGKSAIIRQVALAVIMAQMGCFVAASKANIGCVNKIFTRVGANDNISKGESTFMVEMTETANILNNLSENNLVLLDEVGRGTSTYDGISIAWAITEFLHNSKHKPKTLFATHYHELNQMEKSFERIKNFNVAVKEQGKKILFLRKLLQGGTDKSFGIHVAKLAGVPQNVIKRATEILDSFEDSIDNSKSIEKSDNDFQMSIFENPADPKAQKIIEDLKEVDIDKLSPIAALMKLNSLKKSLDKEVKS